MESAFGTHRLADRQHQDDIAIIGMSCIFPGAPNLRQYWQNIVFKVDAISDPSEQWGAQYFYDPEGTSNDRIYCKRGGYLKELAEFDPLQYGVMPHSLHGAEPGHFLALRVGSEALADAGYFEKPVDGARVEVILGKGAQFGPTDLNAIQHGVVIDQTIRILKQLHPEHTKEELETIKRELKAGLAPFNAETVPGLVSSIVTGRICNRLGFMGANYTVDAACASSLIAVERGIRDLLAGRCDMVLAGGIETCIPPLMLMIFCQINALSRTGRIRPFDKDAAGTLLGEGVGIVVLKRKRDAERDGDRIYALIKGVGVSSDGRGAGLLAPRLEGEVLALERAYEDANVTPQTIGLIEAHGTGVPLGDVTEVRALSCVFGPRRGSYPVCALGSVKSMISHLVRAAGVAGLIKAALAIYHKVLPPTIHCEEVQPEFGLEKTPFYINTETRPWIHGGDYPRRAGVSAFGFGGINAHAVLEEYAAARETETPSLLHKWETELFIIQGDSRQELIASCRRLLNFLSGQLEIELKDLAYSLNCPLQESTHRLSIVAESLVDLEKKLAYSIKKLTDPCCKRIKDRSGIFFFEKPLSHEGTLAFMFPGYGSEYVNMLSDLCIHFPEVRTHFDNLDQVSLHGNREILPSRVLFPAPLDQDHRGSSAEQIFSEMNFVSSAMCTGDLAMLDLLTRLGINPDAVVGHSNGEFAALLAAGAIAIQDNEKFLEYARSAQSVYDSFADLIPRAKVLTVGGGDRGIIASLLRQHGEQLQLTIDNCPHQVMLCGPEDVVAAAFAYLQERGIICTLMPFNHAVHSPLFQPICERIAAVHHDLKIVPPRIAVYGCTTAQLYPSDPAQIRQLIMNHLARPVRFRETIETMYQSGVRIFVEVGPKASLTSFVNDILGDRRFVAVASNVSDRSGITQLNHLIGLLAAHHVSMRPDYLYLRRSPNRLSFDLADEQAQSKKKRPHSVKLSLEYPLLKLKNNGRGDLLGSSLPINESASGLSRQPETQLRSVADNRPLTTEGVQIDLSPPVHHHPPLEKRAASDAGHNSSSLVMNEYLRTMEQFLEVEQVVVETFLARGGLHASRGNGFFRKESPSPTVKLPAAFVPGHFNLTVQSMIEGQELIADCQLDLNEHIFLRDHTLGRSPSALDETLLALPIIPLTISMEIMAQAASLLFPGQRLVGMKNFRSYRWIEVGEKGCAIIITAKVKTTNSTEEVEVRIINSDISADEQNLHAEATLVFRNDYPVAPDVVSLTGREGRSYHLQPEHYYDSMFHGPCFRSVASIDRFDRTSIQATLKKSPNPRLFRSSKDYTFLTDPILLDGAGQVIGFWIWTLDRFEDEAATFPIGFEALNIYGPLNNGSEPIKCLAKINSFADGRSKSDIDLVGPEGKLLAQLVAWENMRSLGWTHLFNQFILAPREVVYSTLWPQPISHLPDSWGVQCCTVADGPGGLWLHVLASMILNRQERAYWAHLNMAEGNPREWLLGRLAAKDASRLFIKKRYGLNLCPADIEIVNDEYGHLALASELVEKLSGNLSIAIANSEGRATAIVGKFEGRRGIGIAIAHLGRSNNERQETLLTTRESDILSAFPTSQKDEWLRRVLCAKVAAARALGYGIAGSDLNLRIADVRVGTGEVFVAVTRELARPFEECIGEMLVVQTGRKEDLIFAVSIA
jgi:acyl transferase domain-containing protein/phosphopantetheinyl transferase (holo-ACP synthase)